MNILGIETSCDETAVCLVECAGNPVENTFEMKVVGNEVYSQIKLHEEFGGVVPMMAKREHAKNLIPLFKKVLLASSQRTSSQLKSTHFTSEKVHFLEELFGREKEFFGEFVRFAEQQNATEIKSKIDAIAVTEGPGLEPALWMGIIFARALAFVFDIPLVPVNHMEGHILSVLPQQITFPALALLISGGHTELVHIPAWNTYKIIGQTRDDAIGEAFDKVARMLGLPYPGGPQISRLAETERCQRAPLTHKTSTPEYILPRPMIHSKDYDFSFSGIKTAVLYSLRKKPSNVEDGLLHKPAPQVVAKEFEDAVTDVLLTKTFNAIDEFNIKTLIIGGGVVSNLYIRQRFEEKTKQYMNLALLVPSPEMRTDNALMIAVAGYVKIITLDIKDRSPDSILAKGNLSLT